MTKPPNTPDEDDALVELQEGFGESVRLARKRHHLTQVELAEKCGMGQEEISRIERGQHGAEGRSQGSQTGRRQNEPEQGACGATGDESLAAVRAPGQGAGDHGGDPRPWQSEDRKVSTGEDQEICEADVWCIL